MPKENLDEEVKITKREYINLLHDSAFLKCLDANGVDNWEGYDIAVDEFRAHPESFLTRKEHP